MTHHHHAEQNNLSERRLLIALALTGLFMLAEITGGILTHSLALLADAGHMLSDFFSLALSYGAIQIAKRPSDLRRTYGYHRFQVLAAFVNGLTLLMVSLSIFIVAIQRIFSPHEIFGTPMLIIALLGLLINIISYSLLHKTKENSLNLESAKIHILGDLLGSVAAILAALIILSVGWYPIDPILSAFVAGLIFLGGFRILSKSGHILLEGTPETVNPIQIQQLLEKEIPSLSNIHHIHLWSLTGETALLTMHATISPDANFSKTLETIHLLLREQCEVSHATVQLEYEKCPNFLSK